MGETLAIIHTTHVTVGPLKDLAAKSLPNLHVINFVDDSILPQLGQNGGKLEEVQGRLIQYVKNAEALGADIILNACSSVGEIVPIAREEVSIPIIRIDEAMAEAAIIRAKRIGVAATLATTLNPTIRLLKEKAKQFSTNAIFEPVLIEEAYKRLINGDKTGHDELLANVLTNLADRSELVVLAQVSMARVLEKLPKPMQSKFLTSPELGIAQVKQALEESK
ncbi:aspartate/glutamate racemase family protein [uncultured Metabacillus sp.]|uniref:aspartate/glutamate racemase family protein n=1 Tax=uncultured Metabacillus sp. TaxID=2860135 RepID=UPI00261B63D1|nr:aspartate/glutamate racemase family protein [uncultured Metabacillus sp.]